jgi:hypothetical protein
MDLKKERLIEAANESREVAKVLKVLFPEAFINNTNYCLIGSIFKRKSYPHCIYAIVKINGFVKVLNITQSTFWNSGYELKISDLQDKEAKRVTVTEFKLLVKEHRFTDFELITFKPKIK